MGPAPRPRKRATNTLRALSDVIILNRRWEIVLSAAMLLRLINVLMLPLLDTCLHHVNGPDVADSRGPCGEPHSLTFFTFSPRNLMFILKSVSSNFYATIVIVIPQ